MLPDWILDLESVCAEGTLVLLLRSFYPKAPFFILASLGCIPEGRVEGAFDLCGVRPETLIREFIEGLSTQSSTQPFCRDASILVQQGRTEKLAFERARALLHAFMTPDQRTELAENGSFRVRGKMEVCTSSRPGTSTTFSSSRTTPLEFVIAL